MSRVHLGVNAGVPAALTLLALVPLASAYDGPRFVVAAAGGVGLGVAIAVVGTWRRWGILTVAGATLLSYFLVGAALTIREEALGGLVPTPSALSSLGWGAIRVWKQALTLQSPFVGFDQLTLAPYIAGLLGAVVSVSLALRVRRFGFALLPTAAVLLFSVFYSTYDPISPALLGAVIGGLSLGWVVWRAHLARGGGATTDAAESPSVATGRTRGRRAATIVGVLALTVAVGGATAALPLDRYVLRDHVVPPLELYDYPSPLMSFRKMVTDGEDATLFTITGLPAGSRIRLATLDAYDGIVFQASGSGGAASGVFTRVGRHIPAGEGTRVPLTVDIADLTGAWIPTVGYLASLAFDDATGSAGEVHYNTATGTAVLTGGLVRGERYAFDAVIPERPSEKDLADAKIAPITTPRPARVPDEIALAADEATAAASTPIGQVRAVEAYLQTNGYFSHGLEGEVSSRSGHGAGRIADLFASAQMIGDDEQYAVAMALMLAQLGIPVRVVMGFSADGSAGFTESSASVTGDDVHAWVEVPFEDYGWVPFWPTPAEDKVPEEETTQQQQKPRTQVAQPPPDPQEPAELPPPPPVEALQDEDEPEETEFPWYVVKIAVGSILGLGLLIGPSAILAIIKGQRRRRRANAAEPSERLHGGWAELVDAATDVAVPLRAGATRREQGALLDALAPAAGITLLADRADAAVFGAGDPVPTEIEQFWTEATAAGRRVRRTQPWRQRVRATLFPRSVLHRRRRAGRGGLT